ncbi:hypothetical protein FACS1894105_03990 [Clostridia bacterium]|nr:hypothetical protein FACS1894105_03990 [Clostridia bacterium]
MVLAMVFSLGILGAMTASAALTPAEKATLDSSPAFLAGIETEYPESEAFPLPVTTIGFKYTAAAINPDTDVDKTVAGTTPVPVINVGAHADTERDAVTGLGLYFDLVTETLVNTKAGTTPGSTAELLAIDAYSIDNGAKWIAGAPDEKAIANLIKKGGTLILTDHYDAALKGPAKGQVAVKDDPATTEKDEGKENIDGGSKWVLAAAIQPAPKAPKYVLNYKIYEDQTGNSPGYWTLTAAKGAKVPLSDAVFSKLQIAYADKGKTPLDLANDITNNDEYKWTLGEQLWGYFPFGEYELSGAISVFPTPAGSKPDKRVYLVRTAPYVDGTKAYPGSPAQKISVVDQQAAPKLKVDLKKDQLKLKAGQTVFFAGEAEEVDFPEGKTLYTQPELDILLGQEGWIIPPTLKTKGTQITTFFESVVGENVTDELKVAATYGEDEEVFTQILKGVKGLIPAVQGAGVVDFAKGNKDVVDLEKFLTEDKTYIVAWTNATEKKPASTKLILEAPARQLLGDVTVASTKGKVKPEKIYEFFDTAKGKYGTVPKITSALTGVKARIKATNDAAASRPGIFSAAWGIYNPDDDAKKQKKGVTTAQIAGYPYNGRLALTAPSTTAEGKVDGANYIKADGLYNTFPATDSFSLLNVGLIDPDTETLADIAGATGTSIAWTLTGGPTTPANKAVITTATENSYQPVINGAAAGGQAITAANDGKYTLTALVTLNADATKGYVAAANYLKYASASTLTYSVSFTLDKTAPAVAKIGTGANQKDDIVMSPDGQTLTIKLSEPVKGSGEDGAFVIGNATDVTPVGDILFTIPAYTSDVASVTGHGTNTIVITFKTAIVLSEIQPEDTGVKITLANTITDLAGNALTEKEIEFVGTQGVVLEATVPVKGETTLVLTAPDETVEFKTNVSLADFTIGGAQGSKLTGGSVAATAATPNTTPPVPAFFTFTLKSGATLAAEDEIIITPKKSAYNPAAGGDSTPVTFTVPGDTDTVTFTVTVPADGSGTVIAGGDTNGRTLAVSVPSGTTSVTLTGSNRVDQILTSSASSTASVTNKVNATVAISDVSLTTPFTLTVTEDDKSTVVYTVTVTVEKSNNTALSTSGTTVTAVSNTGAKSITVANATTAEGLLAVHNAVAPSGGTFAVYEINDTNFNTPITDVTVLDAATHCVKVTAEDGETTVTYAIIVNAV